jgi:SSS family solute:Na+ symporter/sodium/proline symporter
MFSTYYWPRANKHGALAGSIVGVAIIFFHLFLALYVDRNYVNLSLWGMHPGLVAFIPNAIVFVLITYLTPPPSAAIQEKFHGFLKRRFRFARG